MVKHSILAFYYSDQPVDAAGAWQRYPQQQQYVNELHSNNIKIMVSVGGGSVQPTSSGWVAETVANNVAQFAKNNLLDGVDLDWEVCFLYVTPSQELI
jgi:GH18 family chitinase